MDYWTNLQDSFDFGSNIPSRRFNLLLGIQKLAEDQQQQEDDAVALVLALAALGGPIRHIKTYLTQSNLPGDPLSKSAWAYLWSARNDRAFVTTMGMDVATFNIIRCGTLKC